MTAKLHFEAFDSSISHQNSSRHELEYELVVDEVGSLVEVIFEKSNINTLFFAGRLNEQERDYLTRFNKVGIWISTVSM
jgi:hypothetical protein